MRGLAVVVALVASGAWAQDAGGLDPLGSGAWAQDAGSLEPLASGAPAFGAEPPAPASASLDAGPSSPAAVPPGLASAAGELASHDDGGAAPLAGGPAALGATLAGFELGVSGYAQVDVVPYSQASLDELDPSTGQPLNEVAISIRHAHLGVAASRWLFAASVEADVNTVSSVNLRLYAAELSVRWPIEGSRPLVQLRAGLVRIPFGVDTQQGLLQRAFLEPSTMVQALFPGSYDLGLELSGAWRFLRYRLAVMNGEPVGERALPAKDPNAAKDVVGRLSAVGSPVAPLTLEAGASALSGTGFHAGAPATKDSIVWRDANEDGQAQMTELQVIGGQPATPSADFSRFALGADVRARLELPVVGALELRGELIWASNLDRGLFVADPVATGQGSRELGWAVELTQALPWGFLVGARFDTYDPDADAVDLQGSQRVPRDASVTTWSALVSWRWERTARLSVQYEHRRNTLGRGLNGAPTTLGSDRLAVRAEVAF